MKSELSNLLDVGRTAGVFGLKGWVKVVADTEPKQGIVGYSPWWLKTNQGAKIFEVDDHKFHHGNLVVHFKGVDDRDTASQISSVTIAIDKSQLPSLEDGDFYWHQLIGMAVSSKYEGRECLLGRVKDIIETGANDVLVVSPVEDSIDQRERLVPYIPEIYISSVDVNNRLITVEWDPEF